MDYDETQRILELETRVQELESKLTAKPAPPDPGSPRHKAARLLAWLFALSFLLLIASEMATAVHRGIETTDAVTTLMLTTGSLLVGVTGSYLSRNLNQPPGDRAALESRVGLILTITLGGMLLIMSVANLYDVLRGTGGLGLSDNSLNVFAVLLAGIIGALGGYLGFRPPPKQ